MIKFDKEYLEKRFPNLLESLKGKGKKIEIDGVEIDQKEEKEEEDKSESKTDKSMEEIVVDYIRLCEDEEEALDVIDFMEEKRGVNSIYTEQLRKKLETEGLRSFGSKREPGEYPYIDKNKE